MPYHVSSEEFERIADAAFARIPPALRARLDGDNVMIIVQHSATAYDRENDIDRHVLGYYEGADDSAFGSDPYPKRIVLLQRHIEDICESHEELVDQVTDTVLHEVGHYFGMSHDDIADTRLHH